MLSASDSLISLMSFAAGSLMTGAPSQPYAFLLSHADNGIPNNPRLPLIFYPRAVPQETEDLASWFEGRFTLNQWQPRWRYPVYPYSHFHPNSHEMLGMCAGWAEILFGGDGGRVITVHAGDAVLIPAGVGHKQIAASEDFFAVGAYPCGLQPQTLRDDITCLSQMQDAVKQVAVPAMDPLLGDKGGVTQLWHPLAAAQNHSNP
ncbi:hypothetical protein BL250_11090 [Erwinia sp. OLTSP20]|uniref:hypothetical protein n=1 Tax=unclassified Erwinia TaxID=2622719 RepID=UPI000C1A82EF|nr:MULTISPECIES: hypothetical protein [unclassified Erwinia]PIJ50306.1 hypothetical protein BV501_09600 [Erwinia sp. OAMSP11]PIJ72144.1 hypothetical protein BK416_10495 [Erwinia sp. OLSSP12]PIJ81435.1 hypothetical protein BLD47_09320 [Erwinia sp. OLCASP19]PIJ84141.1 hypothetical protein BLD46_08900 [Erwinia sp. OLMTSP26]PIJ85840.1 hypothetical protein BLD49_10120 [Erwinia sp. OLMDSP33]